MKKLFAVLFTGLFWSAAFAGVATDFYDLYKLTAKEVAALFDTKIGDYLYPGGQMSEQLMLPLNQSGEHGDLPHKLNSRLVFFAGCRPQSCDEKSAAVIDVVSKRLVAIGLRHFHCRLELTAPSEAKVGDQTCDAEPTIDLFLIKRNLSGTADHQVLEAMHDWSSRVGAKKVNFHICKSSSLGALCN